MNEDEIWLLQYICVCVICSSVPQHIRMDNTGSFGTRVGVILAYFEDYANDLCTQLNG